jgi:hypothetical protein
MASQHRRGEVEPPDSASDLETYADELRKHLHILQHKIAITSATGSLPHPLRIFLANAHNSLGLLGQAATPERIARATPSLKERVALNLEYFDDILNRPVDEILEQNQDASQTRVANLLTLQQNAQLLKRDADIDDDLGGEDWGRTYLKEFEQALTNAQNAANLVELERTQAKYRSDEFLTEAITALNGRLEEHFKYAATEVESRVQEFAIRAEALKTELETTRDREIEILREKVETELATNSTTMETHQHHVQDRIAAIDSAFADWLQQAQIHGDAITHMKEDAENSTAILAGLVLGDMYSKSEVNEGKNARNWRLVSLALGFAGIGFLLVAVFVSKGSTSLVQITPHLAASAALGSLSAYAGRQAAEHRREQLAAREKALMLVTFRMSLNDQPEETKSSLREKLSLSFLNQHTEAAKHQGNDVSQIDQLIELLKTIKSKG